jgi:hypothetical protein
VHQRARQRIIGATPRRAGCCRSRGSSGTAVLEAMKTLLMLLALSLAAVKLAVVAHMLLIFIRAVVST